MNIAELFVDLGVKGSDKSVKQVREVRTGLKDVASSGMLAKTMLVGVMYGMQRLMSHSGQAGATLEQFANLTGLSTDKLQRWQYAAKMSNLSAEEMTGSIKGVQQAMARMSLMGEAPMGFGMLANTVGFDMGKIDDTFYVMDKLKEFAKSTTSHSAQGNEFLKSFGLSEGSISFLRSSNIEIDKLNSGLFYSEKGQKALAGVNAGFSKLGHNIEKSIGDLTLKYGPQLLKDLNMLIPKIMQLTKSFADLANSLGVFKYIGMAFEGWGFIADDANKALGELKSKGALGFLAGGIGSNIDIAKELMGMNSQAILNPPPIQSTVNFYGNVDAKQVADGVKKGLSDISKTYYQNKALGQGN